MIYDWDKINQQLNDFKSQIWIEQTYEDPDELINKMIRLSMAIMIIAEDMCLSQPTLSCSNDVITINLKCGDITCWTIDVTESGYQDKFDKNMSWDSLISTLRMHLRMNL